jgi:hypothetical protein
MQGMVQDIAINWFPQMPNLVDTAQPNCYMCHRGNVIPPGDADDPERPAQVTDPEIRPLVDLPVLKPILPEQ